MLRLLFVLHDVDLFAGLDKSHVEEDRLVLERLEDAQRVVLGRCNSGVFVQE